MHLRTANDDDEIATLRAEVRALSARVALLEQRHQVAGLGTDRTQGTDSTVDAHLLRVLAAEVEDRAFGAADVIEHARVVPALVDALADARIDGARSLGHFLRAAEQRPSGAIRVWRIGEDMHGIVWRCEVVW